MYTVIVRLKGDKIVFMHNVQADNVADALAIAVELYPDCLSAESESGRQVRYNEPKGE